MSILFGFFLSSFILSILIFSYRNIIGGISYYTYQGIQENRVVITQSSNIFQILDRDIGGIPIESVEKIQNDPDILSYKILRFIDIPVLGTFRLFQFGLAVDVPVFSLETGDNSFTGIGISRPMLDYYNYQFAGTHPFFPHFSEGDLLGKSVILQFGASKLFTLSGTNTSTYSSKIHQIDADFPGFGIVIPYDVALGSMRHLGYSLNQPYRIVIYLRNISDRQKIEERYKNLILHFDRDTIQEKERVFQNITEIFVIVGIILLSSTVGFLFLLFLSYFREMTAVFELIRFYHIRTLQKLILLLTEPIVIITSGSILTILGIVLFQIGIIPWLQTSMDQHGIGFILIPLSLMEILFLTLGNVFLMFMLLLFIVIRKK